ncbi:hypothetical protein GO986_21800 [Deinococcus sp. HMF7620]|uniref:Uncharacterized protein n=1 Tax=Deinococcus arboris TaxID=2682977 RepID=A0A7C9HUH0_9DEIO|nr:hypothetical protein [Deinococcus arboris]MVN89373.1 hypothetical protein [Deinococcus arboris]
MRRPVLAAALLGILAAGGVAFAVTRPRAKAGQAGALVTLPTGADKSLPPVQVGVATGYAPSVLIDTGQVDYSYIGPGWAYAGVKKDW